MNFIIIYYFYQKEWKLNKSKSLQFISGTQLRRGGEGGGGWGSSPLPFWKTCSDFPKKSPGCVHPQVKFTIQNVALRVSRRKNSEIFHAGPFFLEFLVKSLSKCPNFTKPTLPWKMSRCAPEFTWSNWVCYTHEKFKTSIKSWISFLKSS